MNLEQQKKQARELLRAIRSGNPDALSRLRNHHARWAELDEDSIRQLVSLHDAQFVLAREQGFSSWPKLKAYAEPSSDSRHTQLFVADVDWLTDRVHGLMQTRDSAGPAALEQIREWHPRFADLSDEEIRQAPFTEEDGRLVYAREHGFETWNELTTRVNLLTSNPAAATTEPFMAAFAALQAADTAGFEALLRANPRLASERGTNGNTLLNLAVSLAGKPDSKGRMSSIEALLATGSNVNEGNDRGWTPLHQAAHANKPEIAALLIKKGAALDAEAHGAGGTPLIAALFWGIARWPSCWVAIRWLRAISALLPDSASWSRWMLASTPMAHLLPRLAPLGAFTVRIAVSLTGSLRQIRRRFSTKHSCGHARATAWGCWNGSSERARA